MTKSKKLINLIESVEDINPDKLKKLWVELGNIPIDDNDKIEEPFLHFKVGTPKESIWHWFDDKYPEGVAALMNLK